jgi:hypothetical protein
MPGFVSGSSEQRPTESRATTAVRDPKQVDLKPFENGLRDDPANELDAIDRGQLQRLEREGSNP